MTDTSRRRPPAHLFPASSTRKWLSGRDCLPSLPAIRKKITVKGLLTVTALTISTAESRRKGFKQVRNGLREAER